MRADAEVIRARLLETGGGGWGSKQRMDAALIALDALSDRINVLEQNYAAAMANAKRQRETIQTSRQVAADSLNSAERAETQRDKLYEALHTIAYIDPPEDVLDGHPSVALEWAGRVAREAIEEFLGGRLMPASSSVVREAPESARRSSEGDGNREHLSSAKAAPVAGPESGECQLRTVHGTPLPGSVSGVPQEAAQVSARNNAGAPDGEANSQLDPRVNDALTVLWTSLDEAGYLDDPDYPEVRPAFDVVRGALWTALATGAATTEETT